MVKNHSLESSSGCSAHRVIHQIRGSIERTADVITLERIVIYKRDTTAYSIAVRLGRPSLRSPKLGHALMGRHPHGAAAPSNSPYPARRCFFFGERLRTTKLYDRTADVITLDKVEQIVI